MATLLDRRLVSSFLDFLQEVIRTKSLPGDKNEAIEVAVQVLRTAFDIDTSDETLRTNVSLSSLFEQAIADSKTDEVPEEVKQKAEVLKNEGNDFMNFGVYDAAVQKYTAAIELYRCPIYYCNRAAALSKLGEHMKALDDCKVAVSLDPAYCKAYGRMGLAYFNLGMYADAAETYKKAYELDPSNESFLCNMRLAENKASSQQSSTRDANGWRPALTALFNSPAFMQTIYNLSQLPSVQSLMASLGNRSEGGGDVNQNISAILELVQLLSQTFDLNNPNLAENIFSPSRTEGSNEAGNTSTENSNANEKNGFHDVNKE
uniref:SGTA homodimerisation domain-containing protein n=1 Tax=Trichuris muris TaxID=70415 RepID=A0A5S6QVS1_TRIMR